MLYGTDQANLVRFPPRRHTPGIRQKEKSYSKSCFFLFSASAAHIRHRIKGAIFFKILPFSPFRPGGTHPAPDKRSNLLKNPAFFSFPPRRHVPGTGQKENSSSKSCLFLLSAPAPLSRNRAKGEFFFKIQPSSLHTPENSPEAHASGLSYVSRKLCLTPKCL